VIYQTLPQPSHLGDTASTASGYGYKTGAILGASGFLKVTVNSTTLKVEYIKYDGSLINSHTLTK